MKDAKNLAETLLPKLLEQNRTRTDIANFLGVSDSTARGFVSEFAQKEPLISHHMRIGYKRPLSKDDIGEMMMTYRDLDSKERAIKARKKQAAKWLREQGIKL